MFARHLLLPPPPQQRKWAELASKWAEPMTQWIKGRRAVSTVNYSSNSQMPRVLITGGTDGIGREAAIRMAAGNHDVTISGRDSGKADDVIRHCQQQFKNTPRFIRTDLSSVSEVIEFAEKVAEEQYDICILNAGVMLPKNSRTAEDREATMMTNLISSYMIVHKILETRRDETRPLHFVFTTSIFVKFHSATPLGLRMFNPSKLSDWQKALQPSDVSGAGKYAISKLGMATLSSSISAAQHTNVTATCVHPGTVYTNIMSNLPSRQKFYIRLARPFTTSLADAGANLVRAAESPLPAGMYYDADSVAKLPELIYSKETLEAFEEAFRQFRIR